LVPPSDEFEGRGESQRTMSPGTKTAFFGLFIACVLFMFGKTCLSSCVHNIFPEVVVLVYALVLITWRLTDLPFTCTYIRMNLLTYLCVLRIVLLPSDCDRCS